MADADLSLRDDVEKRAGVESDNSDHAPRSSADKRSVLQSMIGTFSPASFKRNQNARMVTEATDSEGRALSVQPPAEPPLAMKLKGRHLQMIAIEVSIGTGLFVGSGSALATGGPASLIIA